MNRCTYCMVMPDGQEQQMQAFCTMWPVQATCQNYIGKCKCSWLRMRNWRASRACTRLLAMCALLALHQTAGCACKTEAHHAPALDRSCCIRLLVLRVRSEHVSLVHRWPTNGYSWLPLGPGHSMLPARPASHAAD